MEARVCASGHNGLARLDEAERGRFGTLACLSCAGRGDGAGLRDRGNRLELKK